MTIRALMFGGAVALAGAVLIGCASSGGGGGGGQPSDDADEFNVPDDDSKGCGAEAPGTAGATPLPQGDLLPAPSLPQKVRQGSRAPAVDLSPSLPTPCNQGALPSCVGWVGAYGLMTYLVAENLDGWTDLNRTNRHFSPGFVFNQRNSVQTGRSERNSCSEAGMFLTDLFTLLRDTGCTTWAVVPYSDQDCETQPDRAALDAAGEFRIAYFRQVEQDLVSMQTYLAQGIPVVATIWVGTTFGALGSGEVYDSNEAETFLHAVLVAGYDDQREALKVMNSWGTQWGENGYGWIAYDAWETITEEAYVVGRELVSPYTLATEADESRNTVRSQTIELFGDCLLNPVLDSDGDGYPDTMELEFANFGFDPDVAQENPDYEPPADEDEDGWPDDAEDTFGTDRADPQDFPFVCGYELPEALLDTIDEFDDEPDGQGDDEVDEPIDDRARLISTFDSGDDGWLVEGGLFAGPTQPVFTATDGSPDGHISAESSGAWYWVAPAAYLGDQSSAYGWTLSFDLNNDDAGSCRNGEDLVILSNGDVRLGISARYSPAAAWTGYSIRLDETAEWFDLSNRQRANEATIRSVLANLVDLRIRGWHLCTASGSGGLDNVVLNLAENTPPAPDQEAISSNFDSGPEGWLVAGGSFDRAGVVVFQTTDGNPDGYVEATGTGAWYWIAPPEYRGDFSAAYGRFLKFDLNNDDTGGSRNLAKLVILDGGGHSIFFDGSYAADPSWTSYSIRLDETELWLNTADNQRVTKDVIESVLADLQQVKIRGWHLSTATGGGGLDNVSIQTAEPSEPPPNQDVFSGFDTGPEGWAVASGSFDRTGVAVFNASGGSPGGQLEATGKDAWHWIAPPAYRGDFSASYGKTLSFDLNNDTLSGCRNLTRLVVLNGGGHSLALAGAYEAALAWTHYSVRLDETEEWFDEGTGVRATSDVMQAVLEDLTQIRIRGWHLCTATGTGGLDNVLLKVTDEPPPSPDGPVAFTFDTNDEGWTVAGGSLGRSGPVLHTVDLLGGSIETAGSDAWYWLAPSSALGDVSSAYGKQLQFDLRNDAPQSCRNGSQFVVLEGGGHRIYFDIIADFAPGPDWTSYSITLSETELWFDETNNRVSRDVMLEVLGNLGQLKIKGWLPCTSTGTGGLDNVVLPTE